MPSTYSPNLRIELIATGEQSGIWGATTNTNLGSVVEQAISGVETVDMPTDANYTLTSLNALPDEARNAVITMTSSVSLSTTRSVIVPSSDKLYLIKNSTTGGQSILVRTSGGTGVTIANGKTALVYCDSTNVLPGLDYVANAGTADKWTTARNLAGNSVDGSANVPFTNKFIVQGTTDAGLTGAQFLGALGTGLVKNTATTGVLSIASAGTDYAPATSGTSILYGNGTGGFSNVTIGSGVSFSGGTLSATGSGGTVTAVSVASANGFAGTSSGGATPALTLSTSVTGMLKGNGTAISAGTANTDYLVPALSNTAVTGFKTATFNSQTTIATTTGSITVDWTTAQNQKQTEPTGTITYTFTAPPGPCHLQLIIDSDGTSTAQTINWPGTVVWMGSTWAGANNKKAVINFWYDGANYFAVGTNQV